MGRRVEWREGAGTAVGEASFEVLDSDGFRASPIARVYEAAEPLRLCLDDPAARQFPQLDELRAEGASDYLALPIVFTSGEIHVATFATRQRGGFSDAHVAALVAVTVPLRRVTEIYALRRTAAHLVDTYVGHDAGTHILGGQIRAGFTETIEAVIWLSDMRGF